VTAPKGSIKERLSRYREIKLSVIGRKSGRTISMPVWFVLGDEKLYLLPVQGSDTQWYRNVRRFGLMRVVEKFREKYGATNVKKYYSKFDVAVVVELD
jgi:hypothetical protein